MIKKCINWATATRRRGIALTLLLVALIGGGLFLILSGKSAPAISAWEARAQRRAYFGAPPVIPHAPLGSPCIACHAEAAKEVPGIGTAPANPHLQTPGMSAASNCRQCHVFQKSQDLFVKSNFLGSRQTYEPADRLFATAPPVIPHQVFMKESCLSCHSGPAARAEIRCSHPERINCRQCHVPQHRVKLDLSDGK